ncbi:MAG: glycosyltransferase family 9 protein [Blastocatellia bacterium]
MRILIVKLSSIGDVVHALPTAAFLKRAMPDAHISWVVERRASAILEDSPVIDQLIVIDTRSWRRQLLDGRTIFDARARLDDLRQSGRRENGDGRVDVAIDLQGLIKSAIVARASGAERRIGFESSDLREKASRAFLTEQVDASEFTHVIEKNLALARAAAGRNTSALNSALGSEAHEFPIKLSPADERFAASVAADLHDRFAILNPGGGWPTKLWPAERFGQLADLLLQEHGLRSVVTYGPGEEHLAKKVAASSQACAGRPLASTLKQFVALARHARLFVGGDTGPLHLAAATGTPIVGIYGPTSAERNGPFDKRDIAVGLDLWCRSNCHRRRCWHWECMDIPLSAVATAVSVRLGNSERKDTE